MHTKRSGVIEIKREFSHNLSSKFQMFFFVSSIHRISMRAKYGKKILLLILQHDKFKEKCFRHNIFEAYFENKK